MSKTVLIIDNYDSFVYNLVRMVKELGHGVTVKRNDMITIDAIKKLNPTHIILSPGPCTPAETGLCPTIVKTFINRPILGVCLGHQVIATVNGAKVIKSAIPMHGKTSKITHNQNSHLFDNIPRQFNVARYHSLSVAGEPDFALLTVTATCNKEIMAFSHKQYPHHGIQFHPESILTEYGSQLILNFLNNN